MHIELLLRKSPYTKAFGYAWQILFKYNNHYSWWHVGRANPKGVRLVSEDNREFASPATLKDY